MTHPRMASVPSAALLGGISPRDPVPHYTCLVCGAGPDVPCGPDPEPTKEEPADG